MSYIWPLDYGILPEARPNDFHLDCHIFGCNTEACIRLGELTNLEDPNRHSLHPLTFVCAVHAPWSWLKDLSNLTPGGIRFFSNPITPNIIP